MTLFDKTINLDQAYAKAVNWVKRNTLDHQGIIITSRRRKPYPEVTGYFIPTLMEAGEHDLALQYAEYLCSIQQPNGSFAGDDGKEYIFDSGQVLRGLLSACGRWEKFKPFAQKTADYLVSAMKEDGCLPAVYEYEIPAAIQVYALPALAQASRLLNEPRYLHAAQRATKYYKKTPNALFKNNITHFLAYIIDGFIDMDEADFVRETVKDIFSKQKEDGSIPAYPNVNWVCSVGVAQFGIIAYKLGMYQEMDAAIQYLARKQNNSGGWRGSYGIFPLYFQGEEISWANKFFMDLVLLKKSM